MRRNEYLKKKILFLINDLSGGGAEKILVNLINSLDVNKYDITCKTLFNQGINRNLLKPHIKYEYYRENEIRWYPYICKILPSKLLHKIIIKKKYDLEVAFLEGPCTKIVGGSDGKSIAWVHTQFTEKQLFTDGYFNIKQAKKTYLKMDAIVSVSKDVETGLKQFIDVKTKILYNPILINYCQKEEQIDFDDNYINFVAIGRLNKVKGFDRLINSFSKLSEFNKGVRLYIYGEGPEKENLRNLIRNLNLDNVFLEGYKENVQGYLKKADVFVCSSYREGYSTVANEAILMGVPVITTDCSGMKEILLNGKLGIIVENSENALYLGIKEIILNEKILDTYKQNIEKYKGFVDFESRLKEIERFLDQILE